MMAALDTAVSNVGVGESADEFLLLFEQYRLKAFHFALQTVGNRDDAMDITQEAFLRLHRHWKRRDSSRPFAPWMYSVVRNLSVDVLRRRGVRKESDLDALAPVPHHSPTPESAAANAELSTRLWREIHNLPDVQREALLLRDWHGLPYKEIAEITGTNVTTVNSRLHDARTRLRERLRRYL